MVLLTGGGTGGHLFPALAVAEELRKRGLEVFYLGSQGGLEARLLPETSIPHALIPAGKLDRSAFKPKEAQKLLLGLRAAWRLLVGTRPRAILSTGGYAGFPGAMVGELKGIPVLLHEQNAKLGLAIRLLAPMARGLALSVPVTLSPGLARKARVTGYPVREVRYPKAEAKARLGFPPDKPLLLILGGSQGSLELNEKLPPLLKPLRLPVLHQVGERWLERYRHLEEDGYRIAGFVDAPLAMSAADLLLARAGAGTLAEAAYHRLPALLFPLSPSLDGGAQAANAQAYRQAGGAELGDLARLAKQVEGILAHPEPYREGMARLSPEGAAGRLADWLEEFL
ncbi:UDP-N-acetylglucosamine--N-acetylmuramyl-(pentapeptide) pyrophosphoryl-undecaprenol N-acetylglucosamine transferase [Thermus scotoductus]|uniref:UDP-N-acetylglucosamine--N-acetylmuramyl-(pentapeptide) pyrophosphoryl-undecaprenol N-acetylglucosamine transferase n=1 Tax=Thermus scotoductus TaxID=37636 RepID=A0A430RF20_THESC|nr:glycosyltransferase [Thermus scotoductus]RTH06183.1 UDP-N-acetylglucosamine--N-acetylmuramyl-(pentapeptide) pyrophosphoryl-undecaprenol N-acetylglucosamine transferase [Thermus scotoductus]RTH16657.1 UDP-N-acetylglucosamine--N-acetylmuramyl-(pentapeptide) pyrophosphoryl-undecaprenol N-acetylglucosamine transferase [Thermus scotoductus]RTH96733.1 UDP-N-acetylglucosamine--N-acetylmuramyl-(pentapeptide) pyrophosphoryl-undecaprenol N-acetylglucosamine transferase [Thermus scotoductus]RTI25036.1 